MAVNKAILVGRLTADPEIRLTRDNKSVANISLAVNERYGDKEHTEFFRVSFFGRLAEIAGEWLKKGQQVYIEGRIRTQKYTDKEGIERQSVEINADVMQMVGSRGDSSKPSDNAYAREKGRPARRDDEPPL